MRTEFETSERRHAATAQSIDLQCQARVVVVALEEEVVVGLGVTMTTSLTVMIVVMVTMTHPAAGTMTLLVPGMTTLLVRATMIRLALDTTSPLHALVGTRKDDEAEAGVAQDPLLAHQPRLHPPPQEQEVALKLTLLQHPTPISLHQDHQTLAHCLPGQLKRNHRQISFQICLKVHQKLPKTTFSILVEHRLLLQSKTPMREMEDGTHLEMLRTTMGLVLPRLTQVSRVLPQLPRLKLSQPHQ